ncbi:fimbrial protein [Ralstonia sp. UBA689]|uniref:fimbrial protein n=1 Tax=Ralstonia sp. UBA689 TaxID=1947373 RepID=UPI0025EBEE21|nr:fimbrial protein [Ralstonia sp. UBA689]
MHGWCTRLAAALILMMAKGAFAYTCNVVNANTLVQPKAVIVQRDMPVNSLLAQVVSGATNAFRCSNDSPRLTYQEIGIKAFGTYVGDIDGKRVYKTNVEGIGYAVGIQAVGLCDGRQIWVDGADKGNVNHRVLCGVGGMFPVQPMTAKALINFYKTAEITGTGSVSMPGKIGSFILRNERTTWQSPESNISLGAFNVSATSCTVRKATMTVDMGPVTIGAFNGPGTSPSNKTKAFSIPLTCSKGASVNLQLDGAVHDPAQGMLKLDAGGSSASGVAIQLLHDDQPVELAKRFKWRTAEGDGNYEIPLKARYVQVDNDITAGVANGSATFTLTYQ